MINDKYDIETCSWCNGEGIDQSFKGNPYHQPACGRCAGSGKVYVTEELSTTKRRRKYMGPVPKPEIGGTWQDIPKIESSTPVMVPAEFPHDEPKPHEIIAMTPDAYQAVEKVAKRRGRPPKKVASGNNPT